MRSINYLLFGKPCCFADCLDYMETNRVIKIEMELKSNEVVTEEVFIKKLSGFFIWHFLDTVVCYEEPFGGLVEFDSKSRQLKSLENANRRLKRRLADFDQFHLDVLREASEFDESEIDADDVSGTLRFPRTVQIDDQRNGREDSERSSGHTRDSGV